MLGGMMIGFFDEATVGGTNCWVCVPEELTAVTGTTKPFGGGKPEVQCRSRECGEALGKFSTDGGTCSCAAVFEPPIGAASVTAERRQLGTAVAQLPPFFNIGTTFDNIFAESINSMFRFCTGSGNWRSLSSDLKFSERACSSIGEDGGT